MPSEISEVWSGTPAHTMTSSEARNTDPSARRMAEEKRELTRALFEEAVWD